MTKTLVALFLLFALVSCESKEIREWKEKMRTERSLRNQEFLNASESPLADSQLATFSGLKYFPLDPAYRVEARIEYLNKPELTTLRKTKDSSVNLLKVARLHFELDGEALALWMFKPDTGPLSLDEDDYCFVPFFDETNGSDTYSSGRYLYPDCEGVTEVVLDFNSAMNPYCAYNHRWNCTMPPPDNQLPISIKAGEKAFH